jgi:hypothetical protein
MLAPAITTQFGDIVTLDGKQFRRKARWYTLDLVRDATVSKIFTGQIQIDPNQAPFQLLSIHAGDTADGNALTSQEDWSITAQDNENGYIWSDGYVPRTGFAGSREFGYNLPEPSAIRANTRITISVKNKAAAPTAGTATITLRGWQLIPV